jgi:hypothetical protein
MDQEPPRMFRTPTDPPGPLPPLRADEPMIRLHTEWARLHEPSISTPSRSRLRARTRALRLRLSGPVNDRYMGDVVRAIDAIAVRCDELSERVTQLSTIADDLASSVSEEVTELRTIVGQLSRHNLSAPQSSDR